MIKREVSGKKEDDSKRNTSIVGIVIIITMIITRVDIFRAAWVSKIFINQYDFNINTQ